MEQNITPLVHLLSTADAETIAMNLDEIEYEYAYYLAIHQANEECLATDVHTAHNKIYWLRRLRNVFAQVAGIGFPTED